MHSCLCKQEGASLRPGNGAACMVAIRLGSHGHSGPSKTGPWDGGLLLVQEHTWCVRTSGLRGQLDSSSELPTGKG